MLNTKTATSSCLAYEILLEKPGNIIVGIVFRASANLIKLNSGFVNGECDIIVTECDIIVTECDIMVTECDIIVTECDIIVTECDIIVTELSIVL